MRRVPAPSQRPGPENFFSVRRAFRLLLPLRLLYSRAFSCLFAIDIYNYCMKRTGTILPAKPRHIPIRTCVACRETSEKRQLLRVVRQEDATRYDAKGKLPGRGAYVCARPECIALARKQKKLERSLKTSGLTEELFTELEAAAQAMGVGC